MQVYPSQISPSDNYDIFYFLRNHTDASTYYVQAKVYDVRTGEVLRTVNLSQSSTNSRLFATTLAAPGDPSGYGRNIVAIATVYVDSGYTTKSTDYEEQEQYFLVRTTLPQIVGGGGVDYHEMREIVGKAMEKAIGKMPKHTPHKPVQLPDMPFSAILGAIGTLQREMNRVPKDGPDLSPIQDGIAAVYAAMAALPLPAEPVDLSPVTDSLEGVSASVEALQSVLEVSQQEQLKLMLPEIKAAIDQLGKALEEKLVSVIEAQEFSFPVQRTVKKPEPAKTEPLDITHLM